MILLPIDYLECRIPACKKKAEEDGERPFHVVFLPAGNGLDVYCGYCGGRIDNGEIEVFLVKDGKIKLVKLEDM